MSVDNCSTVEEVPIDMGPTDNPDITKLVIDLIHS
jgi:hypothetical protein